MKKAVLELKSRPREGEVLIYHEDRIEGREAHELLPDLEDLKEAFAELTEEVAELKQAVAELAKIAKGETI